MITSQSPHTRGLRGQADSSHRSGREAGRGGVFILYHTQFVCMAPPSSEFFILMLSLVLML